MRMSSGKHRIYRVFKYFSPPTRFTSIWFEAEADRNGFYDMIAWRYGGIEHARKCPGRERGREKQREGNLFANDRYLYSCLWSNVKFSIQFFSISLLRSFVACCRFVVFNLKFWGRERERQCRVLVLESVGNNLTATIATTILILPTIITNDPRQSNGSLGRSRPESTESVGRPAFWRSITRSDRKSELLPTDEFCGFAKSTQTATSLRLSASLSLSLAWESTSTSSQSSINSIPFKVLLNNNGQMLN